jgi:DNA ligase D-like protein (predicted polymerase)/DNA ligase D-like protein (predicted 3'-phosphoesterase)
VANLREYRRKRDAGKTPEPVPEDGPLPGGNNDLFVVQEHHARRLHYDVRLERDGVLVSWAVPKGLLIEPGKVRLAVHTEDHPMEYAAFEGRIPHGEYGAGEMIIWDRGRYETIKWSDDEVEVILHGEKVEGGYVFFRAHDDDPRNWLVRRKLGSTKGAAGDPPQQTKITVRVENRQLRLTNMQKVLYPAEGFSTESFTKAEVIDYYRQIAPVLLPHLHNRPVTFKRYPDGVDSASFFEKDVSRHAPEWVRTMRLETPNSSKGTDFADYPMIDDLPTLIWAANLAAIELHIPQWRVGARGGKHAPDLMVFDLDPGTPATLVECCRVAELISEVLDEDGLTGFPKTSGAKGLQLYVPVRVGSAERTSAYAKALAERLAREHPGQILAVMAKAQRKGKVFIDWSQNNSAKTTVAPYSLRAREQPTVSTPVTWGEVRDCERVADLMFLPDEVVARVGDSGDLLANMAEHAAQLPR